MKQQYRIRNWSEYNAALKQRGSVTFWFSEEVLENWMYPEPTGAFGAPVTFSDIAIETLVIVKSLYHLAGRQATGFVESIFKLMGLKLRVPDHSTVSRRMRKLQVSLPVSDTRAARHVVVDSTGIKVYGEGEWKVRQHGVSKRRTWLKLHLGVDEKTGEIVAAVVSTNNVGDPEVLPELIDQVEDEIEQVSADGIYSPPK